jgi:tripartite-type tricarboxylate transporter receptor subunit TctC
MPARPLPRRALLAAGAATLASPALAQAPWPSRPIRLVVPFAPGGSTDVVARLLAEHMSPRLGQPIVVENRPGAGSTLATGQVAEGPADGHTVLLTAISGFAVGPTLYRGRLNWDPDRSFAHLGMASRTPYALMANPRAGIASVAEMVAAARRNPGLNYATSGVGSIPHLVVLRLAQAAGVEMTHIPYRGGAQAVADTIAGNVPLVLDGIAPSVGFLRAGTVRGLAVTSAARVPDFPDLPTLAESGFRDLVVEGWTGLAVPAATPRPVVERLAAAMRESLALPAVAERLRGLSNEPGDRFLDDMQAFVRAEAETWRPLVIQSGATVD